MSQLDLDYYNLELAWPNYESIRLAPPWMIPLVSIIDPWMREEFEGILFLEGRNGFSLVQLAPLLGRCGATGGGELRGISGEICVL